jgi:hypothetical protein
MRPALRASALLGALALVLAAGVYSVWPHPSRIPGAHTDAATGRSAAPPRHEPTPTLHSAAAAPVLSSQPARAPFAAAANLGFEQPASPQLYWRELERLERENQERALAYALAGDEWYPDVGRPAEARRAKIVTLLVDLHRMSEARERTRKFIEAYPASPYRRLVQGVTGIHPRPGPPAASR